MSPPPGYVAYGGPGTFSGGTRRIGGVSKALVVLTVISAIAAVVLLILQLALRNSAVDFRNGRISSGDFTDDLAPFALVAFIVLGASIASLVLLCVWSFRMAKNLQALRREPQAWKPGWGIGAWLLSSCTLNILPFLMLRELWRGSDPTIAPGDPSWKRSPVGSIVAVWFGLQIASLVVGVAAGVASSTFNVGRKDTDIAKSLDDRIGLTIGSGLLSIAGTVVFILLIRQLSARHMQATREA